MSNDIKRQLGVLVGSAAIVPLGLRTATWDDLHEQVSDIAEGIVGILKRSAINALIQGEDPKRYGLLCDDPDDTPSPTFLGVLYTEATRRVRDVILAHAVIVDYAWDYIREVKGDSE